MRCNCRNVGLPCSGACKCRSTKDDSCQNAGNDDAVENEMSGTVLLDCFFFYYQLMSKSSLDMLSKRCAVNTTLFTTANCYTSCCTHFKYFLFLANEVELHS